MLGKKEFTKPQKRYLRRSRLNKKIKEFASTELKLLQDKGYLLAVAANSSGGVAARCSGTSQQRNKTDINHAQINAPYAVMRHGQIRNRLATKGSI